MDFILIILILAGLVTIATAWGVGAADLANVLSTSIGSKAIKVSTAIFIAVFFEFAGAFFGGGHVSHTLQHDIINLAMIQDPHTIVYAMLAIAMAGASWMMIASSFGLPASITNAIVGGLVGFGWSVYGLGAVNWPMIGHIVMSWLASPLISGVLSYFIFVNIQRMILIRSHPDRYIKRYFPIYCFVVGLIFANMIAIKILGRFQLIHFPYVKWLILFITAFLFVFIAIVLGRKLKQPALNDRHAAFSYVEKKFSILMAFTACAMVFAHGSNDVPIAVAPFSIIVGTLSQQSHHELIRNLSLYTLSLGSLSVIIGLLVSGRKVIRTVGSGITTLTPSRAFSATFATACVVICATSTGIPISVTQTLVGGVLGVGLARGLGALNLNVIRNIFFSWFITIPATSLLAVLYFYFIKNTALYF